MSKLKELIEQLCPDGVPYLRMEACITDLRTGLNPRKNFVLNTPDATNYYITVRELYGSKVVPSEKTDRVNDEALRLINNRSHLSIGDILFSGVGTVGKTALIREHPSNWNIKEGIYAITPNASMVTPEYLLYCLHSPYVIAQYSKDTDGGIVGSISMALFKQLRIPVPPIEVQREIVRILDSMQELDDALSEELMNRQVQHETFRNRVIDSLINGSELNGVEYRQLEDCITDLRTGLNPRKNFVLNPPDAMNYYVTVRELGGFDIYPTEKTDMVNDEALALINKRSHLRVGDILFSGVGTVGKTALVREEPSTWNIKEGIYAITPDIDVVLSEYLLYCLHSSYVSRQYGMGTDGGIVGSISMAAFRKLIIPVPSIDIQQQVVEKLEAMRMLLQAIGDEKAARRKQFEYYRDKLLDFPEKAVSA